MSTPVWVLRAATAVQIHQLGSYKCVQSFPSIWELQMRAILSKLVIGTFVAGAALAVSACGDKTETTTDNTLVTDMNMTDDMGTMTDNMTAVDGTLGTAAAQPGRASLRERACPYV